MKLSYFNGFGNKGNTFGAKDISIESLSQETNSTNIHQYLTPDYFLPASHSDSYYSRKYGGNHTSSGSIGIKPLYQSKFRKLSRVASVMLLSLGFLATAVEVKAQPAIEPNQSFLFGNGSASTSTNAPTPPKMPQSLLASPFDLAITPPAAASAPPVPPAAPAMPDFISDASIGGKSDNRSTLFESIRNFGKGVLRKVKREPKPKVVSSDGEDLMSQLHNTLERRHKGISGATGGIEGGGI